MFEKILVLLLVSLKITSAIDCYVSDGSDHNATPFIKSGYKICVSVYSLDTGTAYFVGLSEIPPKKKNLEVESKDCQIYEGVDNLGNQEKEERYLCYCFQDMCNYPYSFDDFIARGMTLATI